MCCSRTASRLALLLRTFGLVCASSSPAIDNHRHAVLRREPNVSARAVNTSLAAQSSRNRLQHEEFVPGQSEHAHRKESSPSRVGTKARRASNLQMSDLLEVDTFGDEGGGEAAEGEDEEECEHSKANYCDIGMWPYELQQAAGIYGNDRYQCDISRKYKIQAGWEKPGHPPPGSWEKKRWWKGVVQFPRFEDGKCNYMKKYRGKDVPRWGIKIDHTCNVMCKGFRFAGFQYLVPSVTRVKCILKPYDPPPEKEVAVQEGGFIEFYGDNESEKPMRAEFEVKLATGCEWSNYIYGYAVLGIMFMGMLCTGIASARQYYKIHRSRDSDEW